MPCLRTSCFWRNHMHYILLASGSCESTMQFLSREIMDYSCCSARLKANICVGSTFSQEPYQAFEAMKCSSIHDQKIADRVVVYSPNSMCTTKSAVAGLRLKDEHVGGSALTRFTAAVL
eukprot:m.357846 g.357846  ORF g.357846 m.357846 type:complete len:119 (-) comp20756_c1_seq10:133-489(-)